MRNRGVITGVSVSHTQATIDEIAAACESGRQHVVETLGSRDGVREAFAIQTCNRAEAYVVTDDAAQGRRALADFAPDVRDGAVVTLDHEESLRHLMRVAAGLESIVIGEDQIIGQLREATMAAREAGTIGPMLDDALTKAIRVGERARTETRINEGVVSIGSAAVQLAGRELSLDGAAALVVGTGEMGTLAAKALDSAGVASLVVANRTRANAERLAETVDTNASAVGLDAVESAAVNADVVITATSSQEYVLTRSALEAAGDTVVIDIAQPRDVDPGATAVRGVTVCDIDTLETIMAETRTQRREEAEQVEAIIDEEFDRLLDSFKRKRADEAISAMYESAEMVKQRELETALSKLDAQGELTTDQRETVEALADALVSQLLAPPTKSLREAAAEDDWTTIQTAMGLFDPTVDAPSATVESRNGLVDAVAERLADEGDERDIPPGLVEQFSDD
ncbi:MAG: glutamyl-tRNA reductase [Halobacteriota archaeon]